MSWRVEGTYFENCSCDMVCPCTTSSLSLPGDTERCFVALFFNVAAGEVDGVDVSGLTVAVVADAPQLMSEGNWRMGVVIDAAASDAQAQALGGVFSGALGGPMAALAPLIGEQLGLERAPIEYVDDGRRHSVRVGDLIDIEIEDWVPPGGTEVAKLTGMTVPMGSTLTMARATRSSVNAFGLAFSNVGKNGHSAPFAWAA